MTPKSVHGSLSRKAFNLTWNQALEAGGFILGDNVKLDIDVEAVPATAQAGATFKTEPEAALASR